MARDENMIAALKRERAGYVAAGDGDRVAQVDEQLARYGYKPEPAVGDDGAPKGRTAKPRQAADEDAPGAEEPKGRTTRPRRTTEGGKGRS